MSGVRPDVVEAFEAGSTIDRWARQQICAAIYDRLRLEPIPETDRRGEGLRFREPATKRLERRIARAMDGMVDPQARMIALKYRAVKP